MYKHDTMTRTVSFLVFSLIQIWVCASERNSHVDFGLVEWVSSHKDGYFNPKVELRLISGSFEEPVLTMFSKNDIVKDEVITQIPWEMIVKTPERQRNGSPGATFCSLVETLAKEFKLGSRSQYAPYVLHLLSLREGLIPSAWSDEGKYLISQILGGEDQQLPPGSIAQILDDEWFNACGGDKTDAVTTKAAEIVLQREDRSLMVPLYDLLQHRNGHFTNTKTRVKEGIYHQTIARRTISAGEQLYKSHDLCEDCNKDAIEQGYGTPGKNSFIHAMN